MTTRVLIFISAIFWAGVIGAAGDLAGAFIVMLCHALYWRTHVLELKLNKLLDERGIIVADRDLR